MAKEKGRKFRLADFKELAEGLQASCSSRTSLKGLEKKYKAFFIKTKYFSSFV